MGSILVPEGGSGRTKVLVNDPDAAVRARRIGILCAVGRVFGRIADFSRISTR